MSIKPQSIKQHDLQPYYRFSCLDAGTLAGATIHCTMTDSTGTKIINRATAGVVVTDAANCEAEYRWQTGDTNTAGTYSIEFEVTPASGGKFTVPSGKEPARVIITADLDGV